VTAVLLPSYLSNSKDFWASFSAAAASYAFETGMAERLCVCLRARASAKGVQKTVVARSLQHLEKSR